MASVTREEVNARLDSVESRFAGSVDALRHEFGTAKADVLHVMKGEVHRLRVWVLTGAIAALCSLLGFVVTHLPPYGPGQSAASSLGLVEQPSQTLAAKQSN